tara:strand:- start:797 stop:1717 length:921 start_codon:yes stop_codon:yes gene_type:complete
MTVALNGATGTYLRSHWQGQQTLARSFWVNLVLLRAFILLLETVTRLPAEAGSWRGQLLALAYFFVFHVVVYAWQVVGVVRACDRYHAGYGSVAVTWAVHLGLVLTAMFTLANVFASFQVSFLKIDDDLLSVTWEREREARYALTVSDDGTRAMLNGSLELGIGKKLAALLQRYPGIATLTLESLGGNIYEGRGVAKLILQHDLDTYVSGTCASACTTAFIAGAKRMLGPGGRLGFHSYRIDAGYQVPFADPAGEQRTDRAFYEARGIDPGFLDRAFTTPAHGLWYPEQQELLDAGVVHRIGIGMP